MDMECLRILFLCGGQELSHDNAESLCPHGVNCHPKLLIQLLLLRFLQKRRHVLVEPFFFQVIVRVYIIYLIDS
jgi:hypothetical protein